MEELRAVYVVLDDGPQGAADLVRGCWSGDAGPDHPLYPLLHPRDLRGEVTSWGPSPHITVLDALTAWDPAAFDEAVRAVLRASAPVRISPVGLKCTFRAVVIECHSVELERLRNELIEATTGLIARAKLTDDEFARAEWWIRYRSPQSEANLEILEEACGAYRAAGEPPLPSSRHFRLTMLCTLARAIREAGESGDTAAADHAERRLARFFETGEPPWYRRARGLHMTLASGLPPSNRACERLVRRLQRTAWPVLASQLGSSLVVGELAIMVEDPNHNFDVKRYDGVTDLFVPERRPGLKELGRAPMGSRSA